MHYDHELDISPADFKAKVHKKMSFVTGVHIHNNFRVGDIIKLKEFFRMPGDDKKIYSGSYLLEQIKAIYNDYKGLEKGWCIMETETTFMFREKWSDGSKG